MTYSELLNRVAEMQDEGSFIDAIPESVLVRWQPRHSLETFEVPNSSLWAKFVVSIFDGGKPFGVLPRTNGAFLISVKEY